MPTTKLILIAAVLLGTSLAGGASAQTPVPTPILRSIALTPATHTRAVGQIQTYVATGTYSDGSTKNLTQRLIYSSSDLNVAIATNEPGNQSKVDPVGPGTTTISGVEPGSGITTTASGGDAILTVIIPVTPTGPTPTGPTPTGPTPTPILQSISLAPATHQRVVGQTQAYVATGHYADGSTQNLTQKLTYSSSDPNVAKAPNTSGSRSLVTAVGPGTATISAVDPVSGITTTASGGDATLTVIVVTTPTGPTPTGPKPTGPTPTPILESISLAPVTHQRLVGQTQSYVATGHYADGSTQNLTQKLTYSSSDPSVAKAPNTSGSRSLVTAVGPGTATISAVDPVSGITTTASGGDATLTVIAAPTPTGPTPTGPTPTGPTPTPILQSISLSPASHIRAVGQSQTYVATGTYTNGSTQNLTQKLTYSSSDPSVAVATNEVGNKSKVNAVGPGTATISAVDPVSGISTTASAGDATLTVIVPATPTGPTPTGPTPTPTGPTPTNPTATRSATPRASVTATPVPQEAADRKCQTKIVTAGAALVQAEAKAKSACASKIVSGKLPQGTTCATETKTAKAIDKARVKLASAIARACGGQDRTCGSGNDDVSLAAVGWNIGSCPNVSGGTCTNPIADCAGIATCVACIGEAELDQAIRLYYDAFVPADPHDPAQRPLNKCQRKIGSAATTFLTAKSAALAKCWRAVSAGTAAGVCPAPDGKAAGAIAKAESKKVAAICKACGGADKSCGGADDSTPLEIGFAPTCPDVSPPGAPSCAHAVTALSDLVACVDCVTEATVDCASLATVPAFVPHPAECGP
jgi:hypothetical protein